MTLKQPGSGEGLSADIAPVVEVVGEDVHGEGRHGDVHLVADVALLGTAGIETPVSLLVTGEVRTCGVVLAAFGASVPRLLLRHGGFDSRHLFPRASVRSEEGFVRVGRRLAVVDLVGVRSFSCIAGRVGRKGRREKGRGSRTVDLAVVVVAEAAVGRRR